ncbi:MAG: hypothetical protein ABIW82_06080 [Dokdonella sp.]
MSKSVARCAGAIDGRHRNRPGGNLIITRGLILVVLLLSTTACNHRIASKSKLDVCAMAHETIAMFLDAPAQAPDKNPEPSAGACKFTANAHQQDEVSVSVRVYTKAAFDADRQDFEQTLRVILAEASQTFGPIPNVDLTDTAKVGVAYIPDNSSSSQVILSERGVLLEIGVRGLPRERIVDLSRNVWCAILACTPIAPQKAARVSS